MNLPFAALLLAAEGGEEHELFMPAEWFGIVMFILLMLALLTALSFSNKSRELPADPHSDH
ncbi:hypothetical protein [Nesterenkonia sp.]|uniref:hypothetical protein n=1 Tax=Nesterenkonia sp. TaxID=704201 RepID=UPI00260C104D|nr:hypothetical protein [Nesterenkonia sp.]